MSVFLNLFIAFTAVAAVTAHARKAPLRVLFRFYTVLSNLMCAVFCLLTAVFSLSGQVPQPVVLFKHMSTVAVTITLLTVLFFLAPHMGGLRVLLAGPDLWLHLICPVLAIISFLARGGGKLPVYAIFTGALTVPVYGCWYMYHLFSAPEEKRWKDFYGFNQGGKWKLSFIIMTCACLLVSFLLWVF